MKNTVAEAVAILRQGGMVVFPSDTVYGLAVDATNETAVQKLLQFKDRPMGKAISIAVPSIESFDAYVSITEEQKTIVRTLLPGPFTIVLPSKHTVSKALEAEDGSLGIRVPKNKFMNELSASVHFPYTATSANIAGKGPHYSVNALFATLSNKKKSLIDYVVDQGELAHNKPSTVLNLQGDTVKTLREGAYTIQKRETYYSHNPEETKQIAQKIIDENASKDPLVLLLQGELGVGKTVFAQGVGEYLGASEHIISPTYVLYYEYTTTQHRYKKLHHFDLYRAQSEEDLTNLQIKKILTPGNLLIMEWGDRIGTPPISSLLINITDTGESTRTITVYSLDT